MAVSVDYNSQLKVSKIDMLQNSSLGAQQHTYSYFP